MTKPDEGKGCRGTVRGGPYVSRESGDDADRSASRTSHKERHKKRMRFAGAGEPHGTLGARTKQSVRDGGWWLSVPFDEGRNCGHTLVFARTGKTELRWGWIIHSRLLRVQSGGANWMMSNRWC